MNVLTTSDGTVTCLGRTCTQPPNAKWRQLDTVWGCAGPDPWCWVHILLADRCSERRVLAMRPQHNRRSRGPDGRSDRLPICRTEQTPLIRPHSPAHTLPRTSPAGSTPRRLLIQRQHFIKTFVIINASTKRTMDPEVPACLLTLL